LSREKILTPFPLGFLNFVQIHKIMKYKAPASDLFVLNRKNFAKHMLPGTAAVFFSNDMLVTNADGHYLFTQNSNLYYLSGIDQEKTILFLFPDAPRPEWREVLFILKTNATIQIWEGWKYSIEEAREASGVKTIRYADTFDAFIRTVISHCTGFYLDFNEHERNSLTASGAGNRFASFLREEFPAHPLHRAAPILENLRSIKSKWELTQLQEAIDITAKAFNRVLGFLKPGVMEYEVEAEITHEFIRNRATGHAYTPIIGSGYNACVLHYIENKEMCQDGDLILMDFGAEYGNYSADLTRTVPVNGKFSKRQKDIYSAVLRVHKAAVKMLVPGTLLEEYHVEVGKLMESELLGLKLISKTDIKNQDPAWPAYKKYFMHGTSHFLGLDTHDVGNRYQPFKEGMVFTCEPGIYIPEEKIGIRIENDILVGKKAPIDLMKHIPYEVEEIESLMNQRKKK
jgi:Xaa-Pro aminopeptidase